MPRTINLHIGSAKKDVNRGIRITTDTPDDGGTPSNYTIMPPGAADVILKFQTLDRSGVTNEALLAVLIDRILCFQHSGHSCAENGRALFMLRNALRELQERTERRNVEGTEGTNQGH